MISFSLLTMARQPKTQSPDCPKSEAPRGRDNKAKGKWAKPMQPWKGRARVSHLPEPCKGETETVMRMGDVRRIARAWVQDRG